MAHWPKTVRGNLLTFVFIVALAPVVVWLAIALSPIVWASLAVLAVTSVILYTWRRRVEVAKQKAYVGAFTFGDAVQRMRAKERAEALVEVTRRAEILGAR
jgi:hypothetical protein